MEIKDQKLEELVKELEQALTKNHVNIKRIDKILEQYEKKRWWYSMILVVFPLLLTALNYYLGRYPESICGAIATVVMMLYMCRITNLDTIEVPYKTLMGAGCIITILRLLGLL